MTKEQKIQWIKALRSGKYKQGKYNLKNNNKYCSLGVLKEVIKCDDHFLAQNIQLPHNILKFSIQNQLMYMNDAENQSFNEIADWIEENL